MKKQELIKIIEKSLELFKKSEKIFSESLPNLETLKKIESKGVIESFVKHEFEQIRHIDSDQDGIRNMKITQEFYNKLENLVIIPSSKYSDNDYLCGTGVVYQIYTNNDVEQFEPGN